MMRGTCLMRAFNKSLHSGYAYSIGFGMDYKRIYPRRGLGLVLVVDLNDA